MSQNINDLINKAAELEDQTQVTATGDFEYTPPEKGITIGRLIEYIELGKQPQAPYNGKPKDPAEEVRLTFELLHPKKNIHTVEGDDGEKKYADRISIKLTKKFGEKAWFKKLFNALTYGRPDKKHIAQCLGDAYIFEVVHNKSKDGKRTYANIRDDSVWLIKPPYQVDALSGERTDIPVPEALSPIKLFLWSNPTKETWDSLFIDGTRTVKDDKGNETEVSKNWIQELIMSATDYQGSSLENLLSGTEGLSIEPGEQKAPTETSSASNAEIKDEPSVGTDNKTASPSDNPLAALGLS